jgi:hypothetical protein
MVSVLNYPSGFVLFAMSYEQESDIEYAKEYCVENGLTPETAIIKIVGEKNYF